MSNTLQKYTRCQSWLSAERYRYPNGGNAIKPAGFTASLYIPKGTEEFVDEFISVLELNGA